tara:strand:- start:650 stop:829 length:180 start_codon:yes stop_codon:yes gene_type:complete
VVPDLNTSLSYERYGKRALKKKSLSCISSVFILVVAKIALGVLLLGKLAHYDFDLTPIL